MVVEDSRLASVYSTQFETLFKNPASIPLKDFMLLNQLIPTELAQKADQEMLQLAQEFGQAVNDAMAQASVLDPTINMTIIDRMIRRYTAVGAAKKLSNDDEQSGFLKLVTINKPHLTFEYLVAKAYFQKLFDKVTIKNAKDKLRLYLANAVENL